MKTKTRSKPSQSRGVIDDERLQRLASLALAMDEDWFRAPLIYERYNILLASKLLDLSKSQAQIRQTQC